MGTSFALYLSHIFIYFDFSFTSEQHDAEEEENEDGKRGITYEVRTTRLTTVTIVLLYEPVDPYD